ncbi:hypothetical protein Q9189_004963 [Teloschistes chrysophthalmus]
MPNRALSSQQLTLLFKQHKTTVLLLVSSLDTFDSIKEKLLGTLKDTGVTEINGHSVPSEPDEVILGVPIDKNDPDRGWVGLDIPGAKDDGAKDRKTKDPILNSTPSGAGCKDGAVFAFRFGEKESDDDEMDFEEGKFDVVMPTFEDDEEPQ